MSGDLKLNLRQFEDLTGCKAFGLQGLAISVAVGRRLVIDDAIRLARTFEVVARVSRNPSGRLSAFCAQRTCFLAGAV
jgi:hypothetical protein